MNNYCKVVLGDIAQIGMGQSPSSEVCSENDEYIPFLQGCAEFTDVSPSTRIFCEEPTRVAPRGSLLVSVRAPVGKSNIADKDYCIGRGLAYIKSNIIPVEYLRELLNINLPFLTSRSQGSTFDAISSTDLHQLPLVLPSNSSAIVKINSLITSTNAQISQTQSLIEKYTFIKQGMMADLFSRGIDTTTGQLRPSFEEAPELYKETEFGWVPKDWEVCLLKDKIKNHGFVQTGPFGSQLHSYEYVESGVPVIMPQDLIGGRVCLDKIARITESKAASLSRHLVKENDVIFSRRGDLTRSAFISCKNSNVGFFCGTGCLLLRASARVIHGGWFSLLYGTSLIQNQVDGLAVGSTMANLNSAILGKLLSPFPSVLEQQLIYNKIDQAECSISKLRNEQSKRTLQKKGLMQDLLTGKVPVPA